MDKRPSEAIGEFLNFLETSRQEYESAYAGAEMGDRMKNTLMDLNNYLFEVIERLNDDSLSDEQLDKEIKRGQAVQKVAKTIIENGALALQAKKHLDEYGQGGDVELPMIGKMGK